MTIMRKGYAEPLRRNPKYVVICHPRLNHVPKLYNLDSYIRTSYTHNWPTNIRKW